MLIFLACNYSLKCRNPGVRISVHSRCEKYSSGWVLLPSHFSFWQVTWRAGAGRSVEQVWKVFLPSPFLGRRCPREGLQGRLGGWQWQQQQPPTLPIKSTLPPYLSSLFSTAVDWQKAFQTPPTHALAQRHTQTCFSERQERLLGRGEKPEWNIQATEVPGSKEELWDCWARGRDPTGCPETNRALLFFLEESTASEAVHFYFLLWEETCIVLLR